MALPDALEAATRVGEATPAVTEANLVGRRVGNYIIDRPLARGGMGTVFVARHPHLGREVAVKFLSDEVSSNPELARRFLAEAQVTASLHHPNIVDIFDFGELDGRLYYLMELLLGTHLRGCIRAHGRFTASEALPYVQQMCLALEAAHGAGVVHRDLKPGNVFVVAGDVLRVKLLDFGVAKMMSSASASQTRHGQVLGTASHMAPEQALGDVQRITPQSDLYSLGVIVYEMLTGRPVFWHESDMMLMVMHVRDAVTPVRDHAPEVPEEFARVVESCLAKDPAARPPSAKVLAARLKDALGGLEPDGAKPRAPRPDNATQLGFNDTLHAQPAPLPEPRREESGVDLARAVTRVAPPEETVEPPPAAPATMMAAPAPRAAPVVTPATQVTLLAAPEPRAAPAAAPTLLAAPAPSPAPAVPAMVAVPVPFRQLSAPPPAPLAVLSRKAAATPPSAPLTTVNADATLSTLLERLKKRGDFPAFAQSIGEVSKKADAESTYSAGQLGDSILKDYALTSKLLRIVNSTYARRFGGKIYSIKHAIVILGFDRVRSLALTIGLFKTSGKGQQSQRVSDSAIGSLVSGEIARSLAGQANVSDEEAMMCSMFRDLGRHLTLVYLPELYDRITELVRVEALPLGLATERVLGTTFAKLGVAVGEAWRLPPRMLSTMGPAPTGDTALPRPEDRLLALAALATELCELVASASADDRTRAIGLLLGRYRNLVRLNEEEMLELLKGVEQSFQERYSAFGLDLGSSRFMHKIADVVSSHAGTQASPDPTAPQPPLAEQITALKALAARPGPPDAVLTQALRIWAMHLGVPRWLLFTGNVNRELFTLRSGLRDDLEAVVRELRMPIRGSDGKPTVLGLAFQTGRDMLVDDTFAPAMTACLPVSYYEVIGAPAFALYFCSGKGGKSALLLAECESARELPSKSMVEELVELRAIIARAAAR